MSKENGCYLDRLSVYSSEQSFGVLVVMCGAGGKPPYKESFKFLFHYTRRWSFNLPILIAAVFTMAATGSPNYTMLCACVSMWSVGLGGILSVDSTAFLGGFLPEHQQRA